VHRSDHSHLGLSLRVPGNQVPQSENAGTGLALLGVISVLLLASLSRSQRRCPSESGLSSW
jgi:hypothetical protein